MKIPTAPCLGLLAALIHSSPAFAADPKPDSGITEHFDLVYVERGGEALRLDLMEPSGVDSALRPAVMCIHGGGWREGSRQGLRPLVAELARRGYVALTVSYRFAPKHPWPAQSEDVSAALAWLRENAARFRVDRRRIGATGFSAGGQLSLMLGFRPDGEERGDERVQAVVNYFGPTDMRSLRFSDFVNDIFRGLAGGGYEEKQKTYWDFSPVVHASRGDAPVLTFHGTEDALVPVNQARLLHRELDRLGVPNVLDVLAGRGHGWGGDELERTKRRSLEFFDAYLKGGDLPLVASEDFDSGAERWEPSDGAAWKVAGGEGRRFYSLFKKESAYKPKVRSPLHLSLLRDAAVSDFVFDVKLRSTHQDYGHRDLCLYFGYQSPTHFYYVHLGKKGDDHANSIFLVNDAARVSIARERSVATDWDDAWHRVRVRRDVETGSIDVYLDDMLRPVMSTMDKTLTEGRVGVGSFDDIGDFDEVRVWGKTVKAGT